MTVKYWYIVLPVHVIVSVIIFGVAYLMSVGGIDIASLLSKLPMTEHLTSSGMGHLAIGLIFMKLMTPLRFAVTMASSTLLVKRLQNSGWVS